MSTRIKKISNLNFAPLKSLVAKKIGALGIPSEYHKSLFISVCIFKNYAWNVKSNSTSYPINNCHKICLKRINFWRKCTKLYYISQILIFAIIFAESLFHSILQLILKVLWKKLRNIGMQFSFHIWQRKVIGIYFPQKFWCLLFWEKSGAPKSVRIYQRKTLFGNANANSIDDSTHKSGNSKKVNLKYLHIVARGGRFGSI